MSLYVPPTEAVQVMAILLPGPQTWDIRVTHRHEGHAWGDCSHSLYPMLAVEEMLMALEPAVRQAVSVPWLTQ